MRVYDENGRWTAEANQLIRIIHPYLIDAFDAAKEAGMNAREASILINDEANLIAAERAERSNALKLGQK